MPATLTTCQRRLNEMELIPNYACGLCVWSIWRSPGSFSHHNVVRMCSYAKWRERLIFTGMDFDIVEVRMSIAHEERTFAGVSVNRVTSENLVYNVLGKISVLLGALFICRGALWFFWETHRVCWNQVRLKLFAFFLIGSFPLPTLLTFWWLINNYACIGWRNECWWFDCGLILLFHINLLWFWRYSYTQGAWLFQQLYLPMNDSGFSSSIWLYEEFGSSGVSGFSSKLPSTSTEASDFATGNIFTESEARSKGVSGLSNTL